MPEKGKQETKGTRKSAAVDKTRTTRRPSPPKPTKAPVTTKKK